MDMMHLHNTQYDDEVEMAELQKAGRISELETRSIMVRVGSPVKKEAEIALKSSLFDKGMVEFNKKKVKPIQKYAYDKSGSLINQHRQRKDPTVATRINKANWELSKQIENQRDYLIQVMRGRLHSEY